MLNKLKRKIVMINMQLVGTVLLVAMIALSIYYHSNLKKDLISSMKASLAPQSEAGMGIGPKEPMKGKDDFSMAYTAIYAVIYDKQAQSISVLSRDAYIEETSLENAVKLAIASEAISGNIKEENLMYYKIESAMDIRIAFASTDYINANTIEMIVILSIGFILIMLMIFLISMLLAKTAIRPISDAWEEQKRFVANASHELKTPLTVILANNNILASHKDSKIEDELQWIKGTEEEAKHMNALISDMLMLASNELPGTKIESQSIDLSLLVNRIALQCEALAYESNLKLSSYITENLHTLGDEVKLRQMVMILIHNAIKYEPKGGEVTVALRRNGNKLQLQVHNNGSVIAREDLPHIFERFYRADSARQSGGGYGLGLAIAQSIVELHKGKISVESEENKGTTFEVILNSQDSTLQK